MRRIHCPFVDTRTRKVVIAFMDDSDGELPNNQRVVTVAGHANDLMGAAETVSGIWDQKTFQARFKIAST